MGDVDGGVILESEPVNQQINSFHLSAFQINKINKLKEKPTHHTTALQFQNLGPFHLPTHQWTREFLKAVITAMENLGVR